MAIDRHVVGRIGEDQVGSLALHQAREGLGILRVAADQAVAAEVQTSPRSVTISSGEMSRDFVLLLSLAAAGAARALLGVIDDKIDLGQREARELDIEVEVDQALELDREHFPVPTGIEGELVVGDHVGSPLGPASAWPIGS
jgi:hypothetical protein